MASENVHKQEFLVKDIPTRSVILYPSRAHVVRDITDVALKPGSNEISIYGLSPTVDEHSVQIDGHGSATVVDMTVDLVPNREIFEEAYPEDDESENSEEEEDYEDSDDEPDNIRKLSKELKGLKKEAEEALEHQKSCEQRLSAMDRYLNSLYADKNDPDQVTKVLEKYCSERQVIYEAHISAGETVEALNKRIARKENEQWKVGKDERKRKQKLEKQKLKEQQRKERQKAERRKEAKHVKDERYKFWPKKVYKVTLHLESSSFDTPGSSRRASVESVTTLAKNQASTSDPAKAESSQSEAKVSLSLSYVIREASWQPRYDLKVSSIDKTATIIYRAEFTNKTSETWKDAKITLSTSQTQYQGLDDVVPYMHAWRIRLNKYDSGDGGLLSTEESSKPRQTKGVAQKVNRSDLFGKGQSYNVDYDSEYPYKGVQGVQQQPQQRQYYQASQHLDKGVVNAKSAPGAPARFSARQFAPSQSFGHGGEPARHRDRDEYQGEYSFAPAKKRDMMARQEYHTEAAPDYDQQVAEAASMPMPDEEWLDYEESSWEDSGLTATYDVPGTRTLAPSSQTRRHKIATLHAKNIYMANIAVPKLRAAAFLRAKLRNPSTSITLLKGNAGVTLDGSFMGTMDMPRVSPGELFDLPLGVDPAIHVNYPKPSVRRSTQGIFTKESAQVFSRQCWITNTKSVPIELLVLEQIPISEDERLKIDIVQPKGLAKEGDTVRAGMAAREGASSGVSAVRQDSKWGSAKAGLKKNGEVRFDVKLEKRQACLLKLDYEARCPGSERIVAA